MMRSLRAALLFVALALVPACPAKAQLIPGLPIPSVGASDNAGSETPDTAPSAQTATSDLQALQQVIGLLQNDQRRTALLDELRALETAIRQDPEAAKPPAAPAADPAKGGAAGESGGEAKPAGGETSEAEIITSDGVIGAVAAGLTDGVGDLSSATFGTPVERKLQDAATEIDQRMETGFGGTQTIDFLSWALPGAAAVVAFYMLMTRNNFVRRRRALPPRPNVRGLRLLRWLLPRALFGFVPVFAAGALGSAWATFFAPRWLEGQLFVALLSPFLTAVLARQVLVYTLPLLGPTRGWRIIGYASRRLLPWLTWLTALAATANLLREFAVRAVLGRNVADLTALGVDLTLAAVTTAFILRHRLTVRSLLLRGRRKDADDDSRASSALASAFAVLASWWHVVALGFVGANVAARLLGLGSGSFIGESTISILYIFGAFALLAFANVVFARMKRRLDRGKASMRNAITGRYLDIAHVLIQITVFVVAGLWVVDTWGFELSGWLQTEAGQRLVRPLASLVIVPAVIYALWTTIDTAITSALEPSVSRGRARERSARIRTLLPLIRNLVFVVLLVVAVIAVLANIGIDVVPLLAGAGVIGLAFSFGAQQLVQDVITGFFIIFEDTIAIGEMVSTGDRTGTVEGITIRTLKIRDGTGSLHSIPFSQIKALQNNSRGFGIFNYAVGLSFESDAEEAMRIIRSIGHDLLTDEEFGRSMVAPLELWGIDALGAEGVLVKGAIRCQPLQQWGVGREFYRRLKLRFDAADIAFFTSRQVLAIERDTGPGAMGAMPDGALPPAAPKPA